MPLSLNHVLRTNSITHTNQGTWSSAIKKVKLSFEEIAELFEVSLEFVIKLKNKN